MAVVLSWLEEGGHWSLKSDLVYLPTTGLRLLSSPECPAPCVHPFKKYALLEQTFSRGSFTLIPIDFCLFYDLIKVAQILLMDVPMLIIQ